MDHEPSFLPSPNSAGLTVQNPGQPSQTYDSVLYSAEPVESASSDRSANKLIGKQTKTTWGLDRDHAGQFNEKAPNHRPIPDPFFKCSTGSTRRRDQANERVHGLVFVLLQRRPPRLLEAESLRRRSPPAQPPAGGSRRRRLRTARPSPPPLVLASQGGAAHVLPPRRRRLAQAADRAHPRRLRADDAGLRPRRTHLHRAPRDGEAAAAQGVRRREGHRRDFQAPHPRRRPAITPLFVFFFSLSLSHQICLSCSI